MRGFRASRAARSLTSAKFGRDEGYTNQPSFKHRQHDHNHPSQPKKELPAWLKIVSSNETPESKPAPVVRPPRHLSIVPTPAPEVMEPKKTLKTKKKTFAVKAKKKVTVTSKKKSMIAKTKLVSKVKMKSKAIKRKAA